jgi:hypothetical protein
MECILNFSNKQYMYKAGPDILGLHHLYLAEGRSVFSIGRSGQVSCGISSLTEKL